MKLTLIAVAWLICIAGSFHALMTYSGKPGERGFAKSSWPEQTRLNRPFSVNHLVMFVHPGCSCSKASLKELSNLITKHSNITADIVFMKTAKLSKLLRESDLVSIAQNIPRASVQFDQNGYEAKNFGARTSGHVFVYDPNGSLVFNGGITMARGHEGKNAGADSIAEFLEKNQSRMIASSIFGCELFNTDKKD